MSNPCPLAPSGRGFGACDGDPLDFLLGGADGWKVLSVNVTSLTSARLAVVLELAVQQEVDAVALSETSHHLAQAERVAVACRRAGFGVTLSPPLPRSGNGHRTGGTALL